MTALSPTSASSERDTKIYVTADVFTRSDTLGCRVGNALVSATFLSSTSISCTYGGRSAPGIVEVAITENGVDFIAAGNITFLPAGTVTKLKPSSGPLSARVPVLLEGTGFSAMDTPSCSFGGLIVAAEVLTVTTAMCITPPRSSSLSTLPVLVPVLFSNNGVDFDDYLTEGGAFEGPSFLFYPEPVVSSLSPKAGITNGELMMVVVRGLNLAGTSNPGDEELSSHYMLLCRLGKDGSPTSGVTISFTEALCEVSCGRFSGRMSIELSLNNGVHWTESDVGFQCDPLPLVESVWPLLGPVLGGTNLTVTGSGFVPSDSLICAVGEGEGGTAIPVQALWKSTSTVKCLTPPVSAWQSGPTNASVFVSNDGVHFSPSAGTAVFEYVPRPTLLRVTPAFASVAGSSRPLTVTGTNFINSSSASCRFTPSTIGISGGYKTGAPAISGEFDATVPSTFLTTTTVLCPVVRDVMPLGLAWLAISVNGVDFDNEGATLIQMEALPEVTNVVPSRTLAGSAITPVEVSAAGVPSGKTKGRFVFAVPKLMASQWLLTTFHWPSTKT